MKYLFSLLSILVVVIAALLVIPSFIDWSQYKDQIKTQVEKATGYKVEINGELRAAILPTPHAILNNIAIDSAGVAGPVGFKAQVERASVSVALIPLLSKNIVVNDVTLIKPIVDLVEQKQPTADQQKLEQLTTDAEGQTQSSQNVQVESVYIEDAQISYQPLNGEKMSVALPEMTLSADSLKGPFTYNGRIIYNQFDLALNGKIGEIADNAPITISTAINGGAYVLNYNGLVDTGKDVPEIQGELSLKTNSIQSLANQFGAKDIKINDQSMALTGLIAGNAKAVRLDNGQLNLGNAKTTMPVTFNFNTEAKKGVVKLQNIPGNGMIDLDIVMGDAIALDGQIVIDNIKAVASDTLGVVDTKTFDNPQVPNSISGDINASLGDVMALKSKTLTIGDYKLAGVDVKYTGGDAPKIDASIANFEGAKLAATGTLDMVQGVNVSLSHPNAAKFIQVFQKDFKSSPNLAKPFSFAGLVKSQDSQIMVNNMKAKIGAIDVAGVLDVNNGDAIPSIKADLTFGNLDTRALITGKSSTAGSGGSSAASTQSSSGASPWTRDAIDTSALRSLNLDLNAKATTLVHGTWRIANPTIDIDLNNGVLDINTINGGLFGGSVDMSGRVSAKAEGQPLSVTSKLNATNVDLAKLVKAAMSQNKDRVSGVGSFNLDLSTSGLSSSALIYALNGDGKITTGDLVVKGIDLAKVTEAISDESLSDLASVVQGAFRSGQTPFNPIDHAITIREGAMPLNKFTLVSPTANIISDGTVNFASWKMDVKNTIDFTNPDDLPSVEMTLKGPLNAPKQTVANDILISFIKNKYGAKIQKKIQEKLGDSPAGALINNFLGLPAQQPAPANNNETAPTQEAPAEQPKPKIEEQLLRGLFNQLGQ